MNVNDLVSEVIIKDSASAVADRVTASLNKMADAEERAGGASDTLNTKITGSSRSVETTARSFENLKRAADPVYERMTTLANQQVTLQRAVSLGVATQSEANAVYATLKTRAEEGALGIKGLGEAHTFLSGQAQAAEHAIRGTIDQLISGGPSVRAFASHLGELSYAASGPGGLSGTLREAGGAVAGFLTPTTAAVAGAAALAGGFGYLLVRATETETRLRAFDVTLTGMGTHGSVSALGLEAVAKNLQHTGTAAGEAQKAVQAYIRAPGINPASASTILPLARDISAANGEDVSAVSAKMATAFATSTKATIDLVYQLAGPNGLSPALAKSMRDMGAEGNAAGAVGLAIDALKGRFGGLYQDSLSPTTKGINSVTAAWDSMLDSLSKTTGVEAARTAVIGMLTGVAAVARGESTASTSNPASVQDLEAGASMAIGGAFGLKPPSPIVLSQGLQSIISANAAANGVSSALIQAMIGVESSGRSNAISPKGAGGLMQLMPDTAAGLGVTNRFDDAQNVAGGTKYIAGLLAKYSDLTTALEAYNAGPGRVDAYLAGKATLPSESVNYARSVIARTGIGDDRTSGSLVFGPRLEATASPGTNPISNGISDQGASQLGDTQERFDRLNAAAKQFGEAPLYWSKYWDSFYSSNKKGDDQIYTAMQAANQAVAEHRIELDKQAQIEKIVADSATATGDAYLRGEVPGLQASARAAAELAVKQGQATDASAKTREILTTQAAQAINSASQQIPKLNDQVDASKRLADAWATGSEAARQVTIENEAIARTADVVNAAYSTGNKTLIDRANNLRETTRQTLLADDAEKVRAQQNQFTDSLTFDRAQLGRSADEGSVYSRLRSVPGALNNDGTLTAYGNESAATMRLISALADAKNTAQDFGSSLSHALIEGKSLTDALHGAFTRLAEKLADKALDSILSPAFSPGAGGLGGLLGLFGIGGTGAGSVAGSAGGSAIDFGGGGELAAISHSGWYVGSAGIATRAVAPEIFRNAPHFAAGLNAYAPGINEVPIVAHKGEIVGWPQQMAKAFGGKGGGSINHTVNVNIGDIGNGMSPREVTATIHKVVGGAMAESNRQLQRNFNALAADARDRTG